MTEAWHLAQLNGPTELAFTFKRRFPSPGNAEGEALNPDGICVGWE